MKSRDWKDIAELIGIAAIVASLIFVGLQMKQAQDIANNERRMLRVSNMIELNNAINENIDIWIKGNSGGQLDEDEAVVYKNLMINMNDFYFFSARAARDLGNYYGMHATAAEFALLLHRNPGARQIWNSHEDDFLKIVRPLIPSEYVTSGGWHDDIRSNLAKLDQQQN